MPSPDLTQATSLHHHEPLKARCSAEALQHPDNPSGANGLFPKAGRDEIEIWLSQLLLDGRQRILNGSVTSSISDTQISGALAAFDFESPNDLRSVLSWVAPLMERGIVHTSHPCYFGLFNPAPSFPAECADRIVSAFNPQLATATTSPFPVAVEAHVIRAMAHRAGLPSSALGHFTTGGSEANSTALICALTSAEPDFATNGARSFRGQPRMYVSKEAHLAWLKIAHQTGVGRAAVRLVETDALGRMDCDALNAAILSDIAAGDVPVMVAATAGTTGAGMIDPLVSCADISSQHRLWYHVDAAWGGAVIASNTLRGLLDGMERADSITIDAHKWLATTMGCGMFITSKPAVLSDAFHVIMDCMPSNDGARDPYVTTIQWSRRFIGLRLFVSLATAGWAGYAEHVERAVAHSLLLLQLLQPFGWQSANASPLAVLCLRPPPGAPDARIIAQSVVEAGAAWVSAVEFRGELVIRACITNGETTENNIMTLVTALNAACGILASFPMASQVTA